MCERIPGKGSGARREIEEDVSDETELDSFVFEIKFIRLESISKNKNQCVSISISLLSLFENGFLTILFDISCQKDFFPYFAIILFLDHGEERGVDMDTILEKIKKV